MHPAHDPDLNFFSGVNECVNYDAGRRFAQDRDNFCILHHNVRSFQRNYDELSALLDSSNLKPQVLVLSETWFTELSVVKLQCFRDYHSYRVNRRGGGLSIYVRESLKSSLISDMCSVQEEIEVCTMKIQVNSTTDYIIVGIYRPPDKAELPDFLAILTDRIISNFRPSQPVVIIGDLNIDLLQPTPPELFFIETLRSFSYVPLVTKPTHVNVSTGAASLIDHIWSNQFVGAKCGVLVSGVTDHYPVFVEYLIRQSHEIIKKTFRDHSDTCVTALREEMSKFISNFSLFDGLSVDIRARIFQSKFYEMYDKCCPVRVKQLSFKRFSKPWIDDILMELINQKHQMYRDYKQQIIDFQTYNSFNKNASAILIRSKSSNYKLKFEQCQGDIKKTWKRINDLLKPKFNSNESIVIKKDNVVVSDPQSVAESLNAYFSTIANNLDSVMPHSQRSPTANMGPPSVQSFFALPSSSNEVHKLLMSLPSKESP